jgi:hypothetical protein
MFFWFWLMAARAKQSRQKAATTGTKAARGGGARPKRPPSRKAAPKKDQPSDADKDLVKRCAQLESELAGAHERIGELERLNEEAINRIDWVIDSLQTLLESQAKKSP